MESAIAMLLLDPEQPHTVDLAVGTVRASPTLVKSIRVALSVLALLAPCVFACGAEPQDASEGENRFPEQELTGTFTDGNNAFEYVDTHDNYENVGTIDPRKFLYFKKVNGKRAVGLTMDCAWVDAPNAMEILDVLKRNNVKITFFISGPFIFKAMKSGLQGGLATDNLKTIVRMIDDGHEFGSHTQTHPHNNQSIDWTRENEELRRGWDAMVAKAYAGKTIPANAAMLNYWRAPYGEYDRRSLGLAAKAGFPNHFGWNVDVLDSTGLPDCKNKPNEKCLSPQKLTDRVLAFADKNNWSLDGFVILAHLQNPYHWGASAEGLERLIRTAKAHDHVVVRLSEMFATPARRQ
jgi:peptidoglycan/xylan/chitin deacetylase (PgdA/CDA1 family)